MDVPGLALVNQLTLRLLADGGAAQRYLAQDRSSGRMFTLPRSIALALWRMRAALEAKGEDRAAARRLIAADDQRALFGFLAQVRGGRINDRLQGKRFNPIFTSFPLIDLAPLQPRLAPFARALVGPGFLIFLAALMIFALVLGIRSDWAIISAYANLFSLEAISTFALAAPFLKLIHELGHALTATRYGVRLRSGGLYLIGLYPMPYVDCSEADMMARRSHRIAISLAGILVDVTLGLLAFVLWYFCAGSYWQVLVGHVFVFSTLNSILFNANPLVKLDGYYVLADLVHRRNLSTRASAAFADLRLWLLSTGLAGAPPRRARHWGLVVWSVASVLYRLRMLTVISMAVLPKYFGLGMVLVLWGAVVMFAAPLMTDELPSPQISGAARRRRRQMLAGTATAACLMLAFVPMPYHLVLPVGLDVEGRYQFTTQSAGFVLEQAPGGEVRPGTVLVRLENGPMQDRAEVLAANTEGARVAYESVRGDHPAKAAMAARQIQTVAEQVAVNAREIAGLELRAEAPAIFVPSRADPRGTFLASGSALGALLPETGTALLAGPFPERYVDKFLAGPTAAELRVGGRFRTLDPAAAGLRTQMRIEREAGTRSYQLTIPVPLAPARLAGQPGDLRLSFAAEPLWCHVAFWVQSMTARFREAQMADREDI